MSNDLVPAEKLSAAMAALPRPRMREFVRALYDPTIKPGHGRFAEAARRAGYEGTAEHIGRTAQRLLRHPLVIKAMEEQHALAIRHQSPDAVHATRNLVMDPTHKDHWKAVAMIHDRTIGPTVQKVDHTVTVEIDNSKVLVSELRKEMRLPGATEEFLISKYGGGPGGYWTLKAQIDEEDRERARVEANTIEGEFEEVENHGVVPLEVADHEVEVSNVKTVSSDAHTENISKSEPEEDWSWMT